MKSVSSLPHGEQSPSGSRKPLPSPCWEFCDAALAVNRIGSASRCSGRSPDVTAPGAAPVASSTGLMRAAASCTSSILTLARSSIAGRHDDHRFSACIELDHAKYVPKSSGA
jgi:hypothetical protein